MDEGWFEFKSSGGSVCVCVREEGKGGKARRASSCGGFALASDGGPGPPNCIGQPMGVGCWVGGRKGGTTPPSFPPSNLLSSSRVSFHL